MNKPRKHLFSCPAFALNQDRNIAAGDCFEPVLNAAHAAAAAEDQVFTQTAIRFGISAVGPADVCNALPEIHSCALRSVPF